MKNHALLNRLSPSRNRSPNIYSLSGNSGNARTLTTNYQWTTVSAQCRDHDAMIRRLRVGTWLTASILLFTIRGLEFGLLYKNYSRPIGYARRQATTSLGVKCYNIPALREPRVFPLCRSVHRFSCIGYGCKQVISMHIHKHESMHITLSFARTAVYTLQLMLVLCTDARTKAS